MQLKHLIMDKFINPFSDYGWKKIFGSEVSKDLIISFLNEVIQQEVIIDITFRNVEMLGLKQDQRRAVFDIFCENEKGEVFYCRDAEEPSEILLRPSALLCLVCHPAAIDGRQGTAAKGAGRCGS